jgi:anti-anti-sigma regulatory factor
VPPSPPPRPSTGVLVIAGPIAHLDVPGLCAQLRHVLRASDAAVVVCDVAGLAANAVAVDALARMQLTARRLGGRIRLRNVSPELDELLSFAGLAEVLGRGPGPPAGGLRLQPLRQPEVREQPRGVEEAVDRDDAVT